MTTGGAGGLSGGGEGAILRRSCGQDRDDLVLRLFTPRRISGQVVDTDGRAVRGALVVPSDEWRRDLGTITDDRGGFVLDRLEPGEITVVVEHAGFALGIALCPRATRLE